MQIQPINNYSIQNKNNNPQFKSVMPVVFWVREGATGSYGPILEKETSKKLLTKIVNCLNMTKRELENKFNTLMNERNNYVKEIQILKNKITTLHEFIEENGAKNCVEEKKNLQNLLKEKRIKERIVNEINLNIGKLDIISRVKNFIAGKDNSYQKYPVAKGYNIEGGIQNNKFKNISFLLTGNDADYFEQAYGKPIGIARKTGDSRAVSKAQSAYWGEGFDYILKRTKDFCRENELNELHVKMERIRSKTGKEKGYNIVNMRFFPKTGPENPFALINWINK